MNDLGLNLDGPKPLKGVLNIPASGAVAPQGGQKFVTVLENRVQSDLSQVEVALETYEPAIMQPATKLTWTPPTDEIEVPRIIAHHPVDPIIDAERLPHSSVASMGKSAASDAAQPVLQKQPGKLLDLVDQSEVEPTIILQPTTNVNLNATPPADDNSELTTEPDADVHIVAPVSQPRNNLAQNPTKQLSEMHREPTDDTAAAETSPTLDAPIATPHILGTPEPNQGHKQPLTLPNDVTQTDSKVMPNATTPPISEDIDQDQKNPEAVKPSQKQMMDVAEAAASRVTPKPRPGISNKPLTLEAGRQETVIAPVKYLTNTNTLKRKNHHSTQSVKSEQPLQTAPNRGDAIPHTRSENEATEAAAALANLPSKETKNGERQVFSLKIQSEPKDTRSSVRSEAHIQTDSALKLEQNPNSTTPTRVDSQPPGATPTPITFESLGDRNMSQNIKELATQTGGERLQTFASALVLNTRDVQWGQRLVAQIEKLSSNGEGKLELSLRPKNLGDMHISLEFKGDEAQVRIVTETSAASRVLIGAEDRLAQMLDAAGFKLSSLSASSEGGLGQGLGQHTRQKQQSTPGGTKNRDTETGADSKRTGESHNGTVNVIA
ncbi:flagellar hook-length control protein FliK [Planktomarina temperata]|nr:flagellar hook-length control protein FliK [Planktomarina temperata]MDC1339224.1 flagellar hook-length control protein FliK [Planktomarina temperata]